MATSGAWEQRAGAGGARSDMGGSAVRCLYPRALVDRRPRRPPATAHRGGFSSWRRRRLPGIRRVWEPKAAEPDEQAEGGVWRWFR